MDKDSFRSIQSVGRNQLINELLEDGPEPEHPLVKGPGDDAAVISRGTGKDGETDILELLSSETYMEGVDFDLTYTPLHHLGYKVASAAVSDIYAMNGTPDLLLVNLAVPNKLSVDMLREIYRGIHAAGQDYGTQVAGGDLGASHRLLNLSVTAAGTVPAERVRYRSGASEDEAICVSGDLGGAIAGLRILMREKEFWQEQGEQQAFQPDLEEYEYVVGRQLVPAARRDVLEALGKAGLLPGALTDVSQGLVASLRQVAEASGLGCYVYQAALPVALDTRAVADEMKEEADKYALFGGEDYEMLFTLPEGEVEMLAEHFEDFVVVGKITADPGVTMQTAEGETVRLEEE